MSNPDTRFMHPDTRRPLPMVVVKRLRPLIVITQAHLDTLALQRWIEGA